MKTPIILGSIKCLQPEVTCKHFIVTRRIKVIPETAIKTRIHKSFPCGINLQSQEHTTDEDASDPSSFNLYQQCRLASPRYKNIPLG
jgi:hypothetical protein